MAKYNLISSQSDRINFDDLCYSEALYTFKAAPDAWVTWNQSLAEDVVEQDSEHYDVDDVQEAKARQMSVMKKAHVDFLEDTQD